MSIGILLLGVLGLFMMCGGVAFGIIGIVISIVNDEKANGPLIIAVICLGIGWPLMFNASTKEKNYDVIHNNYRIQVVNTMESNNIVSTKTNLKWGRE